MIKGIIQQGKYTVVNSGSPSPTYINTNSGNQGVGNLRYNTSTQNFEVYDGYTWVTINSSYTSVGLTSEAESLLDWAREKRNEELAIEAMAATNPTIADLLNQKKDLDHKIKMVQILTKEELKVGTN
jgi:hypothetical protein